MFFLGLAIATIQPARAIDAANLSSSADRDLAPWQGVRLENSAPRQIAANEDPAKSSLQPAPTIGLPEPPPQGVTTARPILTKAAAWEELKKNGGRWQETLTLLPEAKAKTKELESALEPKLGLAVRHFVTHINPIEYGINEPLENIQWISFGSTGLEFEAVLLDLVARAKIEGSQKAEKISEARAVEFQNDLTALMLVQFLEVQRLKRELLAVDANLDRNRLILKLAKARRAAGAGIPLDIAKAKSLIGGENLKKVTIFTKYMKARQNLALLIGKDRLDFDVETLAYQPIQESGFEAALDDSLRDREDLKIANFAFEGAQLARKEAQRVLWPKISAVVAGGMTGIGPFGLGTQPLTGLAGIQLTMPIWSGGLFDAKREQAEVLFSRAEIGLRETRLQALSEVKESLGLLLNARVAIKASEEYVATSKEESNIAEKRYYSGASNILELTSAHAGLVAANDSNTQAIYSYEKAKVAYFRTIGDFQKYFHAAPAAAKDSL